MSELIYGEKPREKCGVFGIFDREKADLAASAYYALYALQHRGQESCGIAVGTDEAIKMFGSAGIVSDVFSHDELARLGSGTAALGHVCYGKPETAAGGDIQPLVVNHARGTLAICCNGALSNYGALRREMELRGVIFRTRSDVELIASLAIREWLDSHTLEAAIAGVMSRLEGAFSLIMMEGGRLIAVRDPRGFRPLCIGKTDTGFVFASESCALDSVGARLIRNVEPGEIVVADARGLRSIKASCGTKPSSLCIFEYIYFSRPDSVVDGVSVHLARRRAGAFLAKDHPVDADIVIGVPDSGIDAAIGYAEASGIPYGLGFIKNKYIGRTFIQPTQAQRADQVRIKLNPITEVVRNKRVVMVDDSIVRGTTCERIVRLLRQSGATEVHMRVSSPPFLHTCPYGTDIASEEVLIAHNHSIEDIRDIIGVDSLGFLGAERLAGIAQCCTLDFCRGCFTGKYPTDKAKGENDEKQK